MLSHGIKNAILVLLIIMILHVLIKNAIVETSAKTKKLESFQAPVEKAHEKLIAKESDTLKLPPRAETCPPPEDKSSSNDDDELLKYVYGDDNDKSDISSFFKGMDVTKDVEKDIKAKMACPVLKNDEALPMSTTCDPKLQNMSASLVANKEVEANCNLSQPLNTMVLKEYKDESAMNGGMLYGSLSAYDDYALAFQEYDCMKN